MKKIMSNIFFITILIASFYYINKITIITREKDTIFQEIKKSSKKYYKPSQNAKIIGNMIISGKYGQEINYKKSYKNMKEYGAYNETLTVLKNIKPTISIEDNYNKYIISGNKEKMSISLIFIVKENTNIKKTIQILEKTNTPATFFVDGSYIEKNISTISNNKKHEFELLSYKDSYQKDLFKTSLYYLETITKDNEKYCYTEKDNKELLKICNSLNLHTVKPTIIIKKELYKNIKESISNAIIISIEINNYNEKELYTAINYIKYKGYKIETLNRLLSEK